MKSDFSQLEALQKNWEAKLKNVDLYLEELTREVVALFLAEVIDKTPVQSGELQSGWLGDGELSASVDAFVSGLSIQKKGNVYCIEVSNETPYAAFVEYGHLLPSGNGFVKGQYFMTKTAADVEQKIAGLIKEKLVEKLG